MSKAAEEATRSTLHQELRRIELQETDSPVPSAARCKQENGIKYSSLEAT